MQIAERLRISTVVLDSGEIAPPDCAALEAKLTADPAVTHVAAVHCETTTGILNPIADIPTDWQLRSKGEGNWVPGPHACEERPAPRVRKARPMPMKKPGDGSFTCRVAVWSSAPALDVRGSASRLTGVDSTLPEWRIGVVQYWSTQSKVLYSN